MRKRIQRGIFGLKRMNHVVRVIHNIFTPTLNIAEENNLNICE